MDRLIASNSVPLAQADTAPVTGTPQYATDGNPATNLPATLWPAYAFNALQDEIYNVIVGAGLTPNRAVWNQLLTAIEALINTAPQGISSTSNISTTGKINGVNSPNLLFNGSGEFGNAGWQSSNFASLVGGSGEGTLFSNASSISATTVDVANPFAIAAGAPLALSAWVYTGGMTAGAAEVDVQFFNSSMVSVGFASSRLTFPFGQGFTYLSTTFTTPAGTAYACVRKYADASVGSPAAAAFGVRFGRIKLQSGTASDLYSQEASIAAAGFAHGQCRMFVSTTTALKLLPYNGNSVIVNGAPLQLPAAGLTLSNSGLSASTFYYIYLAGNSASAALNASTTGYVTGSNGVTVKSGDSTQTLVGEVYMNASAQFSDASNARYCLSYFNRQNKYLAQAVSSIAFTNTTLAEITTSIRCGFITWSDESVSQSQDGEIQGSAAGTSLTYQASIDGTGGQNGSFSGTYLPTASTGNPMISNNGNFCAEGVPHYMTLLAAVNTGTGTLLQAYTRGMIRG